jgi:sulfatase modifying factor 1
MTSQLQDLFRLVRCGRSAPTPRGMHREGWNQRGEGTPPTWGNAPALLGLLLATVVARAADPAPPPGMVLVPAGEFTMGSDDGGYDEKPAHRVRLSPYFMDRCEVTVAEFAAFVRATDAVDRIEGSWFRFSAEGCVNLLAHYEKRYGVAFAAFKAPAPRDAAQAGRLDDDLLRWQAGVAAMRVLLGPDARLADRPAAELAMLPRLQALVRDQARLPVRCVAWRDANHYAGWTGKRLPTEAEWEKAARGPDGRVYPWGNEWDQAKARAGLDVDAGPSAVGSFPDGASPYGCLDMAGNVWEWCADWYGPATYTGTDRTLDPQGYAGLPDGELPRQDPAAKLFQNNLQGRETNTRKVLRGGCWVGGATGQAGFNNRCARRLWSNPDYWSPDTGFRCAKDGP